MCARLSSALLRTQPDRRLVALAAGGSEPAFEVLVERYRRPLQAFCRRRRLDGASAEDVVQQAFLSTWQELTGDRSIVDIRAWLFRLVDNGAINALKRSAHRHEELSDALPGSSAPEEDLHRRIAVRHAIEGIAALPELQREALLLTAVDGLSHEDVARELGLTGGAVRGLVFRARATLRSAAGAIFPAPVVAWVAGGASRSSMTPERIGELIAGGGAGAAAVVFKGSAAVLATTALAGGAVVTERQLRADPPPAAAAEVTRTERRAPAALDLAGAAPAVRAPGTERPREQPRSEQPRRDPRVAAPIVRSGRGAVAEPLSDSASDGGASPAFAGATGAAPAARQSSPAEARERRGDDPQPAAHEDDGTETEDGARPSEDDGVDPPEDDEDAASDADTHDRDASEQEEPDEVEPDPPAQSDDEDSDGEEPEEAEAP